jgi:hypothetical protein
MEETKWLKPSVSVSRIGDSASVQAVTPVNAEQASKRTMRRPTRQPFRGRLIRLGEAERKPDWISDVLFADRNHNRRPSVVLFKLTQYPLPQPCIRRDQAASATSIRTSSATWSAHFAQASAISFS